MAQIPLGQKFHTLNASTPTKDRGSAQTDSLREIYTMQDIIDSVGGGGGGQTEGEDLSLIVRSTPYSGTGDHEGTVLSIGTLGLTAGTVYMWDGSEWGTANASSDATASGLLGISTDTASAPNVLVSGIIQLASVPGSVGAPPLFGHYQRWIICVGSYWLHTDCKGFGVQVVFRQNLFRPQ